MGSGIFLLLALLIAAAAYIAYAAYGKRVLGQIGTFFALVAFVTLSAGLVIRGLRAAYWPLTNRFEFALCWIWASLAFYLLVERAIGTQATGAFVIPLVLSVALWAARRPEVEQAIRPVTPILRTNWFPLHTGSSSIAYGALTVAGGLGITLLFGEWLHQRGFMPSEEHSHFPSPGRTEYFIWRSVGLGFPWLTLGILTGAIWAQVAWGRYWDWDPKESWTLITWLVYLVFLHGRTLRGWSGRRIGWLAVIGLGAVLFTFLGVGWLVRTLRLESVHVF